MGSFRAVDAEVGSGSVCLRKVLLRSGTSGANLWGVYLGAFSCNIKKLEGVNVGFLLQVTGKKSRSQKYGS